MQPTDKKIATVEQWQALKGVMDGNMGKAKTLTTADYNYPTDNPTAVALWLLEPGVYVPADTSVTLRASASEGLNTGFAVVGGAPNGGNVFILTSATYSSIRLYQTRTRDGYQVSAYNIRTSVEDNLTSTSTTSALSANQGKVLKDMIDALPKSKVVELTTADYDYPENNPDGIALWKLASGEYSANGVKVYYHTGSSNTVYDSKVFINSDSTYGTAHYIALQTNSADIVKGFTMISTGMRGLGGEVLDTHNVQNNLTSTSTYLPLSANQGRVLKGLIDAIVVPTKTSDLTNDGSDGTSTYVEADELATVATSGSYNDLSDKPTIPTVVQTTGSSTTDVMSQFATTAMIYPDYQYHPTRIRIGQSTAASVDGAVALGDGAIATKNSALAIGARARAYGDWSVAIGGAYSGQGTMAIANSDSSIAIGRTARAGRSAAGEQAEYAVALGANASVGGAGDVRYSVALGAYSSATQKGQVDISTLGAGSSNTNGYNNSTYRLLTGLYNPQSAHDAATKGYCDNAIINGGTTAPTSTTEGAVGTQYTYVDTTSTPTAHLCVCVAVDTSVTPNTYTWQTLI